MIGALDRLRLGLRAQEGGEEGGGVRGFAQGYRKTPGGSGGVAVLVMVEVVLRDAGKADEGEDGAGGQEGRAVALVSSLAVSRLAFSSPSAGIGQHKIVRPEGWGTEVNVAKRPLLLEQQKEPPNP